MLFLLLFFFSIDGLKHSRRIEYWEESNWNLWHRKDEEHSLSRPDIAICLVGWIRPLLSSLLLYPSSSVLSVAAPVANAWKQVLILLRKSLYASFHMTNNNRDSISIVYIESTILENTGPILRGLRWTDCSGDRCFGFPHITTVWKKWKEAYCWDYE